MKKNIDVKKVCLEDFAKIYDMLQSISNYKVDLSLINDISTNFFDQKHMHAFSFFIDKQLVGYGSFIIEKKIRGGKVAHIEDIVVNQNFRDKGVGKFIIINLTDKIKDLKCYKITLACKKHNIVFYEKCGFSLNGYNMSMIL